VFTDKIKMKKSILKFLDDLELELPFDIAAVIQKMIQC
jgi:uncharacterized protein (DUF1499 family)